MTEDERNVLLHRFGAAISQHTTFDIDFESFTDIVSSDEDVITLFHSSGFFRSITRKIQLEPTEHRHHLLLARLSELCPLVSIATLSNEISSLFRSFLCQPHQYIANETSKYHSSFRTFLNILCNEFLACVIVGCGEAVHETIVTNFPSFSEALSQPLFQRLIPTSSFGIFQKILEISQNNTDPVKKISAFFSLFTIRTLTNDRADENDPVNLLSQCLRHTATFLNAHPDLIDSFIERVDLPSSPSDTLFRRDRYLNLTSTLSQSSSPLFLKLSQPLLDPKYPLHYILDPRSFTDPASSFFRIASTNPAFFHHIVESHTGDLVDISILTALWTARVVSDAPSESHCLDFGRATQNWIVLLNTLAEVKMDMAQDTKDFNTLPSSFLSLLILFAASTNDELSAAAVSVFSNKFGLSTPHTEALLFATPTTFLVSDAFTPRHSHEHEAAVHKRTQSQSICAETGCCVVMTSRSDLSFSARTMGFPNLLGIHFVGCLVNAFHSSTALPHSFPFFSPDLCGLSQQLSIWNDTSQSCALTALTALTDIEINLAFSVCPWERNMNEADEERINLAFVHLFPFLGAESQATFLSKFNIFYKFGRRDVCRSLDRMIECLIEMATVNSYNTPIALLTETRPTAEILSFINPETHSFDSFHSYISQFEVSIEEKLKTAEGEERWKLVTQLAVVSKDDPNFANEVMKVENDAQAFFILSVHTIRSAPRISFRLVSNPEALDRVIELAGRLDNLPLVAAALAHIADTVDKCVLPPDTNLFFHMEPKQTLRDLVLNTLNAVAARRREGVEEGCAVGKDEMTSQIVVSCLKVLRLLMNANTFDPTQFIDSLVSLTVTTDLSLQSSILLVLQQIEERTQNTPTPFSISTATAPFRGIHQSPVTQQPLLTIISSILLQSILDSFLSSPRNDSQSSSGLSRLLPQNDSQSSSGLSRLLSQNDSQSSSGLSRLLSQNDSQSSLLIHGISFQTNKSLTPSQVLEELNEALVSDITKQMIDIVCLVLEERKASSSQAQTPDDSLGFSLDRKTRHTTPQQLFIALHNFIFRDDPICLSASTFLPLAPFLTRILKIVVPLTTDRTKLRSEQHPHSQFLNFFLAILLSLINAGTPSTLSTPPLSSLLSILSIALDNQAFTPLLHPLSPPQSPIREPSFPD
ncbi:hypothetical protein BLNAU_10087 [Blattamonas nauphoetae]|uniref:Uncharacterized protein n=1 Tax=Blattamonas nauphoetae TaxID=2049346 RepID=A0ABQ9XTY8_9EUKA|nr:hypothetical protein BLNAU_10087 [Blattamonas nauphoetae]